MAARKKEDLQPRKPIWEIAVELAESVPQEERDSIPHDGSINLKHYLYGHPKEKA